ncbi:MAG: winged helix-turn-helix domain-containing protein [Myxococcales bacterium]|nr:winged helix-turn-helix domain-containing protein [Myxococcales bacterium]
MEAGHVWTFLTNHAHVLICLSKDPSMRLRDVAERVGITERAVQRIVHDLHEDGYIQVEKDGRRNHYVIDVRKKLRHPLEREHSVGELLTLAPRAGAAE